MQCDDCWFVVTTVDWKLSEAKCSEVSCGASVTQHDGRHSLTIMGSKMEAKNRRREMARMI